MSKDISEKQFLIPTQPETEEDTGGNMLLGKVKLSQARMHTNESLKHNRVEWEGQTKGEGWMCSHSRKERAADAGPMSAFERDRKMRRESRGSQTNLKK